MALDVPRRIDDLIENSVVLSQSEQSRLAEEALNGCQESRDKLILCNLRMVMREIRALSTIPMRLECADVFSAGTEGLLEELKRFDSKKNIKFITYAYWWVKKMVLHTVYDNLSVIHIPRAQVNQLERLHVLCERKIQRVKGSNPSTQVPMSTLEMAYEVFGTEDKSSYRLLHSAFCAFDIDDTARGDCGDIKLSTNDDYEEDVAISEHVESMMYVLDEREEDIVKRYYGIGCKSQEYDEIGRLYILTPERIRQIMQVALKKMRDESPDS